MDSALLKVVIKKDVKKLQVLGDSMLPIKWPKQMMEVQDIRLESLLKDIKLSFQSFEWFSFNHIPWELKD
jgi:hypothetical protein